MKITPRFLAWLGIALLAAGFTPGARAQKITLTPAMVTRESGSGNATLLVDEQSTAGDPLNGAGGVPTTQWDPGWTAPTYTAYIDLGAAYNLTTVSLFEGNGGTQNVTVATGTPGAWTDLYTESLNQWHKWFNHGVTVSTRYVRLTVPKGSSVAEVVLYGSPGGVAVTGVSVSPTTLALVAGGSATVTATVTPANATNPALTWSSSNAAVASVGSTGLVTGVSSGTATVTATTNDQGLTATCTVTVTGAPTPGKIALNTTMVTRETGAGDATRLVDEQATAGDPLAGSGGAPTTQWDPGWTGSPFTAYIDLGATYNLTAISLFEGNGGAQSVTVAAGWPGAWTNLYTENLNVWHHWFNRNVTVATRYVRLTVPTGSSVAEVVLYGSVASDPTAPAAVADLAVINPTFNRLRLIWTAPGDDGTSGIAASYDLRMSTAPITAANFASATPVAGVPAPVAPGTVQTVTVPGLNPLTTYYFALKTSDEVPNVSALSNVASGTTTAAVARSEIPFERFMGTHAFVDDPVSLMQCVGFIREYHNWNWDEGDIWSGGGNLNYPRYPNNQMQFAPKYGGNWNFDTFYTSVKAAGLVISPCIQGAAAWLQGGTTFPFDDKPVDTAGASTTVPNNYQAKAHHFFQFAARYGSTVVADAKLTLSPEQPRNSGMNLVTYLEDWNEQNKDWQGPAARFSAQEYAAMLSADYDGHGQTMTGGTGTFGAKNADPNLKVVMGGLAENGNQAPQVFVTYLNDMNNWFLANRADHKFAADVINVHHYAWNVNNISGPGPGLSPEADNFESRLKLVVDFRDQNLDPATEVWVSEFGWDTHPGSPLRAPSIGSFDAQEVQGQWLLRAYFAFAAAGVDRAIQFMMRDVNPSDPTWFSTCGLMGPKNDWTPKKSYYYVSTLKNVMTGTRFLGKVTTGNPNVYAYKFKSATGSSGVYVLWCPTSNATTVNGYVLPLSGTPTTATKVALTVGSTTGTSSALTISSGSVTVDVSERPVFVQVDNIQ